MKTCYFFIIIILFSKNILSQNETCGYKKKCECSLTNQNVNKSFKNTDLIFKGRAIKIDTLPIYETIKSNALKKLKSDTLKKSQCAKRSLKIEKVIKVKFKVTEVFKGESKSRAINILTPLNKENCGYKDFRINEQYIVYSTFNETADIYYFWTFNENYFTLKPKFTNWTNNCKRTKFSEIDEIEILRKLKKQIKNR